MERIVVIGGGFAGLTLCQKLLKKGKFHITLIDRHNHHTFQPLLYQVATGAIPSASVLKPLREIFRNKAINILMGQVTSINRQTKQITLSSDQSIHYDKLVIATGARHHYFGHSEWEEYAPGLKTGQDALHLREKILKSFEKVEQKLIVNDLSEEIEPYLTFIVIGAGPTGVELAGTLAEIAHQSAFYKNFREIDCSKIKVLLIEALARPLPLFPEPLSLKAKKQLEELGVTVLCTTAVEKITKEGVFITSKKEGSSNDQTFIASKNVIWAAGNLASPLLKTLGIALDRSGRAIVESDLSIPGDPNVFCIGDCAFVPGVPAVAPAAMQMGRYLAKKFQKNSPENYKKFTYLDKGSIATIGKWRAVGYSWKFQLSGLVAWISWAFIHIYYLIGFGNRFTVCMEWIKTLWTGVRHSMIIYSTLENPEDK